MTLEKNQLNEFFFIVKKIFGIITLIVGFLFLGEMFDLFDSKKNDFYYFF
jgi:hypothetical protein